ncbi:MULTISPECIES: TatD family hydrolase [unclassified Streptomyces]|uniref:TatD family hydrolase n=1 Tax=unclassified Streptomyces TaxID=2593676 RepID=UPI00382784DF
MPPPDRSPWPGSSPSTRGSPISRLAQSGATAAILHWYTGPLALVDEALAAGLWFSVNPIMTTSVKGRALLDLLPPDRVLLETDGPFARHNRRPARPADLSGVVARLATRWALTPEQAAQHIHGNQQRFLHATGLPQ